MKPLRGARLVLGLTFRADPWRTVASVLLQVVESLSYGFTAYGLKLLIDAVTSGDAQGAAIAAGVVGVLAAAEVSTNWIGFMLRVRLGEETALALDHLLLRLTMGIPGIEHLENPSRADQFALLVSQRGQLAGLPNTLIQSLGLMVQGATVLALLGRVHPLLLVLPLFGLPSLFGVVLGERVSRRAQESTAEAWRLRSHLFSLCTTPSFGKEVRVFGLGAELLSRHRGASEEIDRAQRAAEVRAALVTLLGWAAFGAAFVAAIAFVAYRAVHSPEHTSPGDVVLALTLARQVNADLSGAAANIGGLLRTLRTAGRLLWLSDQARAADAAGRPTSPTPVPDRLTSGIEIRQLSFRYPGTDVDVVSDVDLLLPAGSTVAVVGDNGAGKSTLVKLLCRFYEPTTGSILADGVDLRDFDMESWRERVSAAFQDAVRYQLSAQEAVGVGWLASLEDPVAVLAALERANAADVVAALPRGLDTQLGAGVEGGVELSGGQWQKLALGRAMMREPLLLLLDEPTAALDAQAEHALFERYATAASAVARASGAITLLISHRFSTVRNADLIVVVDQGRFVEVGSHDQLVALGGLYAELYELQARGYR